ncbi:MAG TPA: leucine--tRNA ligase, partial [Fimbriimonadaceae bacterium]|nr:leucine--tRNA ligase [Fimbriimonadaceae bacterium]
FTTRIDTIFGMTFCVLAPEHPLVDWLVKNADDDRRAAIEHYRESARTMSEAARQDATREKTGEFTGAYAVNPANGKRVPIWIADYVLIGYGTGAIMAVPAGDQRDLEFAIKFDIPVVPIQKPIREFFESLGREDYEQALQEYLEDPKRFPQAFVDKNEPLIEAGEYTGMSFEEATRALGEWMEALGIGERKIQYKLRDWLISRQRYWGCPIPIIHTKDGDEQLVPEECLPVELPEVEHYEPPGDGTSPLAHIPEFVNVTDRDGRLGRRETDTMGGFACSSWYFLRFCDPHNDAQAWDPANAAYWMPVDCYVGGAEHAVMHLLYARFWTKVLYDLGLVHVKEPFQRLKNQGQMLGLTPYRTPREGEKLDVGEEGILITFKEAESLPDDQKFYRWARMSKSKGNVVTPDEVVEREGADALRIYELFVAPFEQDVQWSNEGLLGASRFLSRVFRMVEEVQPYFEPQWRAHLGLSEVEGRAKSLRRLTHQSIRKATDDIDRFAFNTYISAMMEFLNGINKAVREMSQPSEQEVLALSEALEIFILLLAPAAPHTADELWEQLGKQGFTYHADWPTHREDIAAEESLTIAVQVNGKLRDTFETRVGVPREELESQALAQPKVQPFIEGKAIRKVIVVPDKLVNIVVS